MRYDGNSERLRRMRERANPIAGKRERPMLIQRLIALLILVSAGLAAAYGWILMREAVFAAVAQTATAGDALAFFAGTVLFLGGIGFVGGFLFYRDKKRRRVQKRFIKTRRPKDGA